MPSATTSTATAMKMTKKIFALCAFASLLGGGLAAPASAQMIKPLDVAQDPNGVDLLSGKIQTRQPELSVPGAPNLRLAKFHDLMPVLDGTFSTNNYGPSTSSISVNGGGGESDSFTCGAENGCSTRKKNGAMLIQDSSASFQYYQGGTGKLIYFDLQNGPQTPPTAATGLNMSASYMMLPGGEVHNFYYDEVTDSNNMVWRRPNTVISSHGYTMTLSYQGDVYGQSTWRELAQATIYKSDNMTTPLARLTYSGNSITDLAGRQWICGGCSNFLNAPYATTGASLRLSTDSTDSFYAEAQPRTYGSVTHSQWVTRVTVGGVDWNYAYVPYGGTSNTKINQVTVTAAEGFSQVVNIQNYNLPGARPRINSVVNALGQSTSYLYDNDVRVNRITYPEGNAEAVVYDQIGNITERRVFAKPGSGLADIVETAYYGNHDPWTGDLCYWASCFKPIWTRDALGRQTDYIWNDWHGGLVAKLEPADADGKRRKTINEYDGARLARARQCMADAAGVELTCGTPAEVRTEYNYWAATNLPSEVRQVNMATGEILRTCFKYDASGNKISETQPKGAVTACP